MPKVDVNFFLNVTSLSKFLSQINSHLFNIINETIRSDNVFFELLNDRKILRYRGFNVEFKHIIS